MKKIASAPRSLQKLSQTAFNELFEEYCNSRLVVGSSVSLNVSHLDLRGLRIPFNIIYHGDFTGSNLTGVNFRNMDIGGLNFEAAIVGGPELLEIESFRFATVSAAWLPWLSCHDRFSEFADLLTIVDDEV